MLGVFAFPALLPRFFAEWALSSTEAGWVSGVYFAGYSLAVPVLVSLTDRIDARLVFLGGCGLGFLTSAAFALFADGFWSALAVRLVAGVGHAAVYMPGLRALVDRWAGHAPARAVAFYTSSYSLGTALSFLVSGWTEQAFGWRWAFAVAALAAALAAALVLGLTRAVRPERPADERALLDFRPVLANRRAMSYVVAYAAHVWELFAFRSWVVAFLSFNLAHVAAAGGLSPTAVATLAGLVAMGASLGGQEAAIRFGRRRVLTLLMPASAAMAVVVGLAAATPYATLVALVLVYAALVQTDSAVLTAGTVEAAERGRRGATLAIHALVGYSGAFLGPLAVGIVLDGAGGANAAVAWLFAFIAMGFPVALAPLALRWPGAAAGKG